MGRLAKLVAERLWERVRKEANLSGCWVFEGNASGLICRSVLEGGGNIHVRRLSFEIAFGPIPRGMDIDFVCGEKLCVRPDHLEAVSRSVMLLERRKGSHAANHLKKTHCPQGHPYDKDNTYMYRNSRRCRVCLGMRGAHLS